MKSKPVAQLIPFEAADDEALAQLLERVDRTRNRLARRNLRLADTLDPGERVRDLARSGAHPRTKEISVLRPSRRPVSIQPVTQCLVARGTRRHNRFAHQEGPRPCQPAPPGQGGSRKRMRPISATKRVNE